MISKPSARKSIQPCFCISVSFKPGNEEQAFSETSDQTKHVHSKYRTSRSKGKLNPITHLEDNKLGSTRSKLKQDRPSPTLTGAKDILKIDEKINNRLSASSNRKSQLDWAVASRGEWSVFF
jgi:hypothetical protein